MLCEIEVLGESMKFWNNIISGGCYDEALLQDVVLLQHGVERFILD